MPQKLITMTKKELRNYSIIKNLIEKRINGTAASKQLNLSIRHVKRLKAKVIEKGPEGLIHKQRGKKGNKSYTKEKNNKIKNLLKESYYDFRPTLALTKKKQSNWKPPLDHPWRKQLLYKHMKTKSQNTLRDKKSLT